MKANVCAMRLSIAADHIDQALKACTSIAEKTKIAKSYPELLRAGIKFLTFNQSPPDHVTMMSRLMKCHCDFSRAGMRRLHNPNRYRIDGRVVVDATTVLFDAVSTVSNCLILALADLTQHKFRTAHVNSHEKPWPEGPEDLLPPGPKDSLVGLELWVAADPPALGYIIFKLAGHLAMFYVPFAREIFQSPHFTFALVRPVNHLEEAVKFYDEGDSSPLARTHFFAHPVMAILEFWQNLLHCDAPQFNIMIAMGGNWMSPILARLTSILSTLPPEWNKIRIFMWYLTAYGNAEVDRETGVVTVKFERELMPELPNFGSLENAFDEMVQARKMGCWNITCSLAFDAIHSRLCSKCNLIRFCGKKVDILSFPPFLFTHLREILLQCQTEAWKCATLPHKSVCTKIHSLKEALGADDWSLLWTPDYTYAQFQALCKLKRIDTNIVVRIGSTISGLCIRKSAFLDDSKKAGASQIDRLRRAEQEKLALQKLQDLKDSLGDQSTTWDQEHGFSMMSRDAYH
jgi:hypothetical protein